MKVTLTNVGVWLNMRRKYVLAGVLAILLLLALLTLNPTVTTGDTSGRTLASQELSSATDLYYWQHQKVKAVNTEYWPRADGTKYLTWKSWHAGFNNERISIELAFVFAGLLNRTLVLPPGYKHYNLKQFMYEKFFEFEDIKKAMPVMTFAEFQKQEGIADDYANIASKALVERWAEFPNARSIFVFPEVPDKEKEPEEWARLELFARKRRMDKMRDLKTNPGLATERIIYFPDHQLFTHFYAYIYIRDPHLDRYMKRLVRDHLHLRNDIYDTANVILKAMPSEFYSIHFRRGDFQYQNQRHLTGEAIFNNIKELVPPGSTIYLATDESDKQKLQNDFMKFFVPTYKVLMYGDYEELVQKYIQPNWVGIIEQIICSRGKKFIGTKLSTYSGYIARIRGYSPDIEDKAVYFTDTRYPDGYKDSRLFSTVWPTWGDYWLDAGHWAREFPEAWDGLDEL